MSVPKLRFGEFDGDWTESKIAQVTEYLVDGTHFSPKTTEGKFKYITSKNIRNDGLDLTNISYISKDEHESIYKRCKVQLGDILLTKDGANTGNCCLNTLDEEFSLLSSVAVLRGKKDSFNNKFILQILQSDLGQNTIISSMSGQAISRITLTKLKNYSFNFPDFKEQTKIANFLSSVDEKISQLNQKHALLSQYKQGMMQKLFSQQLRFKTDDGSEFGDWETQLIKDIADVKGGKRLPKGYTLVKENTGHPYITVSDMNRNYGVDSKNLKYVPHSVVDLIKRHTITDEDIFISVAGTLGVIGKISSNLNGANLTENADKLTNLKCHQYFLIYLLDSGILAALIESTATTSAQPKLALYAIEELEINMPCLEEQTKIANFLSAIDQKIEVVAQQIEQAKTWKKGLLQQMFV